MGERVSSRLLGEGLMINGNRTWHKKAKYSVAAFSFKSGSTLFTFYLNIIVTFSKDDSLGEETQFAPENHNKYFKPEHEARSHDSIRDYGN